MSLYSISISFRAWRKDRGPVARDEYLKWLNLGDTGHDIRGWDEPSRSVVLTICSFEHGCVFEHGTYTGRDWHAQLHVAVRKALLDFAAVLAARLSPPNLDGFRATGVDLNVLVNPWIDNDQIDLDFPPEFLLELGRLRLPLEIISND